MSCCCSELCLSRTFDHLTHWSLPGRSPAISGSPSLSGSSSQKDAVSHAVLRLLSATVDFPPSSEAKRFSRPSRVGPAQDCSRRAGSQPCRAICYSPTALKRGRWSASDTLLLLPGRDIAVSSTQRRRKVSVNLQKIITYWSRSNSIKRNWIIFSENRIWGYPACHENIQKVWCGYA